MQLTELQPRVEDVGVSRIFHNASFESIAPQVVVWLVGGAARSLFSNEPIKDYDFAFGDEQSLNLFVKHLLAIGAKKVSETETMAGKKVCEDYVYRYGPAQPDYAYIQIKHEFYGENIENWFRTVDFTVCEFAMQFGKNPRLVASTDGVYDYNMRILRIRLISSPLSTMIRIPKYIQKGFNPLNDVKFYSEVIESIRSKPATHGGFLPKKKRYMKDWKEKFNVR